MEMGVKGADIRRKQGMERNKDKRKKREEGKKGRNRRPTARAESF